METVAQNKKRIMRRIYFIWGVRQIVNSLSIKAVAVVIFAWQFFSNVSIKDVIANSPLAQGNFNGSFSFMQATFLNTEFITLFLLAGIGVAGSMLARDFIVRRKFVHRNALARV